MWGWEQVSNNWFSVVVLFEVTDGGLGCRCFGREGCEYILDFFEESDFPEKGRGETIYLCEAAG